MISLTSKFKSFINDKVYKYKPVLIEYSKTHDTKTRTVSLLWYLCNILFTGLVIAYIIGSDDVWHPAFIRWGLIAAVSTYYLSWLIQEIKRK